MPAVIWADGCMDRAATWEQLFDDVRRNQWHQYSRRAFRTELARRAKIWSGTDVDPTTDLETLFHALETASCLRIVEGARLSA